MNKWAACSSHHKIRWRTQWGNEATYWMWRRDLTDTLNVILAKRKENYLKNSLGGGVSENLVHTLFKSESGKAKPLMRKEVLQDKLCSKGQCLESMVLMESSLHFPVKLSILEWRQKEYLIDIQINQSLPENREHSWMDQWQRPSWWSDCGSCRACYVLVSQ